MEALSDFGIKANTKTAKQAVTQVLLAHGDCTNIYIYMYVCMYVCMYVM